ncbi:unnamed protein product [Taenia asiatica]|uniref:CheW-like domain-containing protein n=1 Tax=Taenia asiatica TaxID=60517 RepID=A0A0R3W327_TAEAS|nr:unnamed protein product [Taenia asiatica]
MEFKGLEAPLIYILLIKSSPTLDGEFILIIVPLYEERSSKGSISWLITEMGKKLIFMNANGSNFPLGLLNVSRASELQGSGVVNMLIRARLLYFIIDAEMLIPEIRRLSGWSTDTGGQAVSEASNPDFIHFRGLEDSPVLFQYLRSA